jgi:hypothetical protein
MKRLFGARKERDCLGKPQKFHSCVTWVYYFIMTSSDGFGILKCRLLKWLPIHSWYRNFLTIKTSKILCQKKSTYFGNIFCKKVAAPRFFDIYVCMSYICMYVCMYYVRVYVWAYVCLVMNNRAKSEATLKKKLSETECLHT